MSDCSGGPALEQEARLLVERLGGRWSPQGALCRCPVHDDRTPSLSVRLGRSRLLLHCFAGCAASDILRALGSAGLIEPRSDRGRDAGHGPVAAVSPACTALRLWDG